MVKAFHCRKLIIIRQAANEGIIYDERANKKGREGGRMNEQFIINLVMEEVLHDNNF